MGEALLLAGIGASATGSIVSGISQRQQAEFQADIAERNARSAQIGARAREERLRTRQQRQRGAARAAFGAAGVTPEGSPLEVLADQAATQEADAQLVRFGGRVASENQRLRAGAFRRGGRAALTSSAIQAGGTLLTGAGAAQTQFGTFDGMMA